MSFPRYPKYKPSGVEWLGEVPEHWGESKLGFESWVRARLGWKGLKAEEYVDDGYAFLSTPNIKGRDIDFAGANFITADRFEESPEIKLRVGDILLAKDGSTLGTVNIVRHLPRPATVNSSIAVISPHKRLEGAYLLYLFQCSGMEQEIEKLKGGMGVPHLFQDDINKFKIPLPTLAEQVRIAEFLDRETAKIDALLAEQRRLMELLKVKRQTVISHAVTRGLNPDAQLKPSGSDWLGDIPTHWEVKRLKFLLANVKAGPFGSSLTKDEYVSSGYRIYGQEQVIPGDFTIGDYFITPEKYSELSQYSVTPGDILISCVGTFGKIAIVPEDIEPGIINPRLIRLRCAGVVHPTYLVDVLRSSVTFEQFTSLTRGGTMDVLNIGTLNGIFIPLPPLREQTAITDFLAIETSVFDTLTAEAESAIDLLRERRTALISAAVTGQIDVRELNPLPCS